MWTQPEMQKALAALEKYKSQVLAAKKTVSLEEFLKYFKVYVFIWDFQNYVDFWLNGMFSSIATELNVGQCHIVFPCMIHTYTQY